MRRKKEKQLKRMTIFLVLMIVLVGIILVQATSPERSAKKQATKIAKEISGIKTVDEFYWFNREETSYTVVGRDADNQGIITIIPEDGTEALIIYSNEGLSDRDAVQAVLDLNETKSISKITLGMYDNKPVWEISAKSKENRLSYYLVDFKTGEIINKLTNL